jgi:hypothetical protein
LYTVASLSRTSLILIPLLLAAAPAAVLAQMGTVVAERENFRAGPQGSILAELPSGTVLELGAARDGWREAVLEGWIWGPSVRTDRRDGHDLMVAVDGGENLRGAPGGDVIARLRNGMRLDRLEARGDWVRVRRTGWIWGASIRAGTSAQARPSADAAGGGGAAGAVAPPTREFAAAGSRGLLVLGQPAGDTVARIPAGATFEVLGREGEWARVRVDGWAPVAALAGGFDAAAVLRGVNRDDLRQNPDRYRGRILEWTVQYISLQQAERFRTDFAEGEPFILARGPGEEAGFIYLAVPADRLRDAQQLAPLDRIRVLGRVRSARSPLTDAPVLDLLEMTRVQEPDR